MKWLLVMMLMLGQSKPDPKILYQDGLAALHAGNWTLASDKLYASQLFAPDAMTFYLLAVAYSHQNQFDQTEVAARRALQFTPALQDQFRNPAGRLMGWAQAMKTAGTVSVQYTMSLKNARPQKGLEAVPARALPEDKVIADEKNATLQHQAATNPCADRSGFALTGCKAAHANDPVRMPATRLP